RASATLLRHVGRLPILLVRHVLAPVDDVPVLVRLLHRDMGHEPRRRRAVPVLLVRLEEDAVARANHLDRPALALAEAYALRHPDGLTVGMRVPGGARAGREVDACGADPRSLR